MIAQGANFNEKGLCGLVHVKTNNLLEKQTCCDTETAKQTNKQTNK